MPVLRSRDADASRTGGPVANGALPGRARSRFRQRLGDGAARATLIGCALFSVCITFAIIGLLIAQSVGFFGVHGDDTPGRANIVARGAKSASHHAEPPTRLMISEVRLYTPADPAAQFIEIAGPPGTRLEGATYLVLGPLATIELALDLTGQTLPRSGFLTAGPSKHEFGARMTIVLPAPLSIDHPVTHLLVRGFRGTLGQELDPAGTGSLTTSPWDEVLDAIGLSGDPAGQVYADDTIGTGAADPVPALAYRDPQEDWTWRLGAPQSVTVSFWEFITGMKWSPLLGSEHHFGVWPLISGTILVATIAAMIAIPLGLITAIFLSEYAPRPLRATLKPVLEVLAGIPTVVYGFFALSVITPSLQYSGLWFTGSAVGAWLGHLTGWWTEPVPLFESYNAASAGIAVGIMCLPIVTSLSEDALQAVPRSLREGAYAVGGTKFDVSIKVVLPGALSGVIAAFLLAIARAVGETMAVSLAAGGLANLTLNPTESIQTMTAWMVQIFLGDASNFGPEYRSAYAVALVLFIMTFILTLMGARVLARFREVYE